MDTFYVGRDRVTVAKRIGQGGEGEVYTIQERSDQAAKIYKADLRSKREKKVRAMISEGLATKTNLIAYPAEIATDKSGKFLGFIMRLVSECRPMHELYSPKSRQRYFSKTDYRFIIRAALNIARAIGTVHQSECVVGDLNHSGVMVSQDATIALIDADSFQFRSNGTSYPCVVGVPEFTPPELHGKSLTSIERAISHDNFGLAVAIFQMLFMGRHPYAGQTEGSDILLGEAIAQNRFAYSLSRRSHTRTNPPPGALTLDLFPGKIADAFERAFGLEPAARPSASDWIAALSELEKSLRRCSSARTHYYPREAVECVWCNLAGSSGFDMFPDNSISRARTPTDVRGTEQAIREIESFRLPNATDLLPRTVQVSGNTSVLRKLNEQKRESMLLGLLMIGGAVLGFVSAIEVWFVWIGLGIWGANLVSGHGPNCGALHLAFQDADITVQQRLDSLERDDAM